MGFGSEIIDRSTAVYRGNRSKYISSISFACIVYRVVLGGAAGPVSEDTEA
jgi:hypothetical protein